MTRGTCVILLKREIPEEPAGATGHVEAATAAATRVFSSTPPTPAHTRGLDRTHPWQALTHTLLCGLCQKPEATHPAE